MAERGRTTRRDQSYEAGQPDTTEEVQTQDRTQRDQDDRAAEERVTSWAPPTLLPVPEPREGYDFRWVRASMLGSGDTANISSKFREGWTPVLAKDFPELQVIPDHDSRFPENIEIGGLILCMAPSRLINQRREHQMRKAAAQIESVDRNYMRESDPRMPVLPSERQSRTSRFGNE